MTTLETPSRGKRPGVNAPCWCASGKKYKRCHREADIATDREEFVESNSQERHSHPEHPLCEFYRPTTQRIPAASRPEFLSLVRQMHSRGATLLHVFEPSQLASDEKNYQAARELLARKGIQASFALDPGEQTMTLLQEYMDRLFGKGAYTVVPSSVSLRHYGRVLLREAGGGGSEVLFAQGYPTGTVLIECKRDELKASGFEAPGRIVAVVAAAGLVQELTTTCADIEPRESGQGLLTTLVREIARESDVDDDDEDVPEEFLLAVGLAFPEVARPEGDSEIRGLAVSTECQEFLLTASAAFRADAEMQALVSTAGGDWVSAAGVKRWLERMPATLRDWAGLPTEAASPPAPAPLEASRPLLPAAPAAVDLPPALVSESLFDAVGADAAEHELAAAAIRRAMEEVATTRDEVQGRVREWDEKLALANEELAKLRLRGGQLDHELEDLEGQLAVASEAQEDARVTALLEVLTTGRHALQQLDRQRANSDELPEALAAISDVDRGHIEVLRGYRESSRRGALDALDRISRQVLEQRVEQARAALGDRFPSLTSEVGPVIVPVPVVVGLAAQGGRIRVGALLPVGSEGGTTLLPDSVETSLAAAVIGSLAEMAAAMEVAPQDCEVESHEVGEVSVIWMECPLPAASSLDTEVSDEADYLRLLCRESLGSEALLKECGVIAEVLVVSAEALEAAGHV